MIRFQTLGPRNARAWIAWYAFLVRIEWSIELQRRASAQVTHETTPLFEEACVAIHTPAGSLWGDVTGPRC